MTTYFDTMQRELTLVWKRDADTILRWALIDDINRRADDLGYFSHLDAFAAIERRVVSDCTFAAMQPEFPADLRQGVHRIVLRYGITTLPDNAPPADFETDDEHHRRLQCLVNDMHSVWHEVAMRRIPVGDGSVCLGDSPRHAYMGFLTRGEVERENIVAAEAAKAPRT